MRLIKIKFVSNLVEVKVYYFSDVQEYQCRVYIEDVYKPDMTYYTEDRLDALLTASSMLKDLTK